MTLIDKPFSQSCENNKQVILNVLELVLKDSSNLLEIGSGTGQHAVYFGEHLSHLKWQTSDMKQNHKGILAWLAESAANNISAPVEFTLGKSDWPQGEFDAVFTANTTHIMQPSEAKIMMQMVAQNLSDGGIFCQYGPFNIDGQYTNESNKRFDQHLQAEGCGGIRDIAELVGWAKGVTLVEKVIMPANNFLLIWRK
ncbi:DUF938 domain-containing protein [Paraglaciecola marina]|uniref:DUF938 domain-containing protein n=1 Tax=Paraglaciecola marina TaxID=2500157 RepID=UPI00105DC7D5|nr:DUF938 domain-containing protein [Paraglaciecola marina]